eukprot:5940792-Karenia_brevis.AAC.1
MNIHQHKHHHHHHISSSFILKGDTMVVPKPQSELLVNQLLGGTDNLGRPIYVKTFLLDREVAEQMDSDDSNKAVDGNSAGSMPFTPEAAEPDDASSNSADSAPDLDPDKDSDVEKLFDTLDSDKPGPFDARPKMADGPDG